MVPPGSGGTSRSAIAVNSITYGDCRPNVAMMSWLISGHGFRDCGILPIVHCGRIANRQPVARLEINMTNYFSKTHLFLIPIALLAVGTPHGKAASITAAGNANIYAAGLASSPNGGLPPSISFAAGTGQFLTVTGVSGSVSFGGGLFCSADGCASGFNSISGTNIDPAGSLSGLIDDPGHFFFLAGVFLTSSAPSGSAPATLDFTGNENFASLAPEVGQVFYIGDGMTSSSQMQTFQIPTTATRAFFGFLDGSAFHGTATFYTDNTGQLSFTTTVTSTPEPGTLTMAGAGALWLLSRRRKRSR